MNILMVNPRSAYFNEGNAVFKRISFPMGLMQLSSAIKNIQVNDENPNNWDVREKPRDDVKITLIDAAAEGFGDPNGEGDPLVIQDNRKLRVFGLSNEEILAKAKEVNPDIIMISAMATKHLDIFYETSDLLREAFPEAVIVAGGIAVSQLDKLLNDAIEEGGEEMVNRRKSEMMEPHRHGVDIVAIGESEISASMIVDATQKYAISQENIKDDEEAQAKTFKEYFSRIPNLRICSKKDQQDINSDPELLNQTESRIFNSIDDEPKIGMAGVGYATMSEKDYNRLPFPDLDLIDADLYGPERAHYGTAKGKWMELFTSRGCSKECKFCAPKQYFGQHRRLSDQRLADLLDYYKEYGFDEICIEDDSILDDPERAIRIFKLIKEKGFKQFATIGGIEIRHLTYKSNGEELYLDKQAEFSKNNPNCVISREDLESCKSEIMEEFKQIGVPINKLDYAFEHRFSKLVDGQEIIQKMADNGCYRMYLAVESANQSTLDFLGKNMEFPLSEDGQSRNRDFSEVIDDLSESQIEAHGGVMMGNPKTEGLEELMNNVRLCQNLMSHGLTRVAFWPYLFLAGSTLSGVQNLIDQYARVRFDFGNVGHSFDLSNIDSLEQGWTAEELITIVEWANQIFVSGEGKNWGKGSNISIEELEAEIAVITDPEILYQTTALRLLKEGGKILLDQYHEAIKANDKLREKRGIKKLLPEYAYIIEDDEAVTEVQREEIIAETNEITERYLSELNEGLESDEIYQSKELYRAEYDSKNQFSVSEMELVMRASLINKK